MPDPIVLLQATAAAALAAVIVLLAALPWRTSRPARASLACLLSTSLGLGIGCWVLGVLPHWPMREDQDRLLLGLLPAVLVVEMLAISTPRVRWLAWSLRLLVAAGAARLLLHGTIYITDLAGPHTREWTPAQTWLILGLLAVSLAGTWALLSLLVRRPVQAALTDITARTASVVLALALACGGAGLALMLSGYASGGQLGFPLAGALAGVAAGSLLLKGRADLQGVLGFGIVGLFGLIVIGRFFGQLTSTHAIELFLAPLVCWIPELPYLRRGRAWLLAPVRVVLTAVPVALVLLLAHRQFMIDSARTAPSPDAVEPSLEDYMNFGK